MNSNELAQETYSILYFNESSRELLMVLPISVKCIGVHWLNGQGNNWWTIVYTCHLLIFVLEDCRLNFHIMNFDVPAKYYLCCQLFVYNIFMKCVHLHSSSNSSEATDDEVLPSRYKKAFLIGGNQSFFADKDGDVCGRQLFPKCPLRSSENAAVALSILYNVLVIEKRPRDRIKRWINTLNRTLKSLNHV